MTSLRLTTVRDCDQEPIATVYADVVWNTHRPHTWQIIATTPDDTPDMYLYGPFTDPDGARAWAEAHLAPYGTTYTVAPLAAPYTNAEMETELGKPRDLPDTAPPARARTITRHLQPFPGLTRLRYGTRADTPYSGYTARELTHPELGPVVELTALGPNRDHLHDRIKTICTHLPRYEVTDQSTTLLLRRRSDAELHARADQAAARVTPHITALTTAD